MSAEVRTISNRTEVLSEAERLTIKKRIEAIDLRLNTMYFQNGQNLNEGGLGDGNDSEIAKLTEERAGLYDQLGLLSPEAERQERQRLIGILIARDEMYKQSLQSGGYSWSSYPDE